MKGRGLMGTEVHISDELQPLVGKRLTVFRCDRCGFLSYGQPEIEPGDGNAELPPGLDVDCGCYMGPRWVKGVWQQVALRVGAGNRRMTETKTCAWCDGTGEKLGVCGWCDGTGIQKPSFHGGSGPSEHRTCGPIRAWCYDCREWCYARGGDMFCECCRTHDGGPTGEER